VIAAILRWLPLSLALHAAALAATHLLPREAVPSPLFIDLTLVEPATVPERPRDARPRPPSAPASSGRAASASAPKGRAAVSPPASSPESAPTPHPAPSSSAAPAAPVPPAATPIAPAPRAAAPPAPADAHAEPPATLPQSASPTWTTPPAGPASSSTATSSASGSSESPGSEGQSALGVPSPGGETASGSGSGAAGAGDSVALGISGDDGGVYAGYVALLRRRVQEALTYPSAARRRGMAGTVHVDISVEPTGRISEVVVVRSSSHEMLDSAALEAVRALRQVPFPPGVRPRAVRVRLPIVFELR